MAGGEGRPQGLQKGLQTFGGRQAEGRGPVCPGAQLEPRGGAGRGAVVWREGGTPGQRLSRVQANEEVRDALLTSVPGLTSAEGGPQGTGRRPGWLRPAQMLLQHTPSQAGRATERTFCRGPQVLEVSAGLTWLAAGGSRQALSPPSRVQLGAKGSQAREADEAEPPGTEASLFRQAGGTSPGHRWPFVRTEPSSLNSLMNKAPSVHSGLPLTPSTAPRKGTASHPQAPSQRPCPTHTHTHQAKAQGGACSGGPGHSVHGVSGLLPPPGHWCPAHAAGCA